MSLSTLGATNLPENRGFRDCRPAKLAAWGRFRHREPQSPPVVTRFFFDRLGGFFR